MKKLKEDQTSEISTLFKEYDIKVENLNKKIKNQQIKIKELNYEIKLMVDDRATKNKIVNDNYESIARLKKEIVQKNEKIN